MTNHEQNLIKSQIMDYDKLSLDIFKEQNKIRTNPQSYIEKLYSIIKYYKDKIYKNPKEIPIETVEGSQGVYEAINFLKNQKPLEPLQYFEELSQVCKEHVKDIGNNNLYSHESSDGKGLCERLEKYVEWDGSIAENLIFGNNHAENIIINMIINDGSKERYQRNNLFNPKFIYGGVACGYHKTFKICTVCVYAEGLYEIGEEPPDNVINSMKNCVTNTIEKNIKIKNEFQREDPYAPDNTKSVKIVKLKKIIQGKEKSITRNIYFLENGKQHIVDIEDKE
jgi:uncharacterized protein YkwD